MRFAPHGFDLVQRTVDSNRPLAVRWAEAAGSMSGVVREKAGSAGHIAREQAAREQAKRAGQAVSEGCSGEADSASQTASFTVILVMASLQAVDSGASARRRFRLPSVSVPPMARLVQDI
jgi:hypothetical protein